MAYGLKVSSCHPLSLLQEWFAAFNDKFLVSVRGLACQQEIPLVLPKTPLIHYGTVMDSAFSNYAG